MNPPIIHRGSREIGGTCVEVVADGTRIVLDIGMPLVGPGGGDFDADRYKGLSGPELLAEGVLPPVEGLYHWQEPTVDAVIVSHAHQDHYGLIAHVHPNIPVYMSEGTRKLIEITAFFSRKPYPLANVKLFDWPSTFTVGPFAVTPHLVDHSAFASFAIEVAAGGKRLFYSGDFRGHGPLGKAMDILYASVKPGVDYLLMEGTMLGRSAERVMTEAELSLEATEICKATEKAVFVFQSGQNVSRAVSFFKAAQRSGRLFIPDVYNAHVLRELGQCKGGNNLPWPGKSGFDNVRVWYPLWLNSRLFDSGHGHISNAMARSKMAKEDMAADLSKIMVFVRPGMESDLESINELAPLAGSVLIYSNWKGYRDPNRPNTERMRAFLAAADKLGIIVKDLHTSGHAEVSELEKMVAALQPKQLVPIHTFHPEAYAALADKAKGQSPTPTS